VNEDKDKIQYEKVLRLIERETSGLRLDKEDKKLLAKLWKSYYKKRKGISRSNSGILAAAVLWQYSKMNFLWEIGKEWGRDGFAERFAVKAKTMGDKAAEIAQILKIRMFDDRFCRKKIVENNPMNNFVMAPSGMIVPREMVLKKGIPFRPLKKTKQDYYYDGCDCLDEGCGEKAIKCFKKALELDEGYVDAYNGLGTAYFDDPKLSKAHYQKAYKLTKSHFNDLWPNRLEWGILENRQYLRAIFYFGLALWRENNAEEAKRLFTLSLNLNREDNLGVRYILAAVYEGLNWNEYDHLEDDKIEEVLERQNNVHGFFEVES